MYVLVLPTRYTYNEKMEINFYRMELLSCFMQNIMYTENGDLSKNIIDKIRHQRKMKQNDRQHQEWHLPTHSCQF